MPWLSILIAIVTAVASLLAKPKKKGQAVALGALAGLGTYYVSHETSIGQEYLGSLDGVIPTPSAGSDAVSLPDGSVSTSATPGSTSAPATGVSTNGWDVLKQWGGQGTAAVLGTGIAGVGLATSTTDWSKWLLAAGALFLLTR